MLRKSLLEMANWHCTWSVFVLLFSYIKSSDGQYCNQNNQCNSSKCCRFTGKCAKIGFLCSCQRSTDCKFGEECRSSYCLKSVPSSMNYPRTRFTIAPKLCFFDSECDRDQLCENGKCTSKLLGWSVGKTQTILSVVAFLVIVIVLGSCCYWCQKKRPSPSRRQAVPPLSTNVGSNGQASTLATIAVADVSLGSLPACDQPPPYSSLELSPSSCDVSVSN